MLVLLIYNDGRLEFDMSAYMSRAAGKKILILYTSVGLGHKFIAENIGWHLSQAGFEVRLEDIGRVQKGKFEHSVVAVHQFINRHLPFVWGWLYRWGHYIILPFRVFIAGFNCKTTKALVDACRPDLVIATQTTASAVVAYLKKEKVYHGKFAIAFSDYHLHPYWLYDQADFYLANTEEQKDEMVKSGISAEKVYVCGITLKPKPKVDAQSVRQKLGIGSNEKVVLVGTGSLGVGFKEKDLEELVKMENVKIIFACGRNERLRERVARLGHPNMIPLGFYTPMDELYAIADVFVSKPGGLSTAESLQWGLPLIVTYTLPGQEEKNMDYLIRHRLVAAKPQNLAGAIQEELQTQELKKQLQANGVAGAITGRAGQVVAAVKTAIN